MTELKSKNQENQKNSETIKTEATPIRCLVGAIISGILGFGLYFLTSAIATAFARTPVSTTNMFAMKIGIAVRTLVIGISALGTGIFAIVTLGLIALAIQLSFKKANSPEL